MSTPEGPAILAWQTVSADDPAAAIDLSGVPDVQQKLRAVKLFVTVENVEGSFDVSLVGPAGDAHSPYKVPTGAVGEFELAWPQTGGPFVDGISVYAEDTQSVLVGLSYE